MKCFKLCLVVVALMCGVTQAALVHQWCFNGNTWDTGTPGGSPATLMGAADLTTIPGQVWLNGSADTYVDLGGPSIAINTYSAFSLVLWSTQYDDQGYTMTAALGGTQDWYGKRYVAISTARGDQVSRAMLTSGNDNPGYQSEVGVNWTELNDSTQHQYVLTVGPAPAGFNTANLVLSFYVDGEFIGMLNMGNRLISGLDNTFAYLGKSLYPGDALWLGNINEFDIYNNALSGSEIQVLYAAGPCDVCIPEPATMVLLGIGSLVLVRRRK
jgi:hypothetical protein